MANKRTTNTEDVPQLTRDMRTKLANEVIDGTVDAFLKIKDHKNKIVKLRAEFAKMQREPKSAQILGCRTWTQFCNRKLHRAIRTIQILLQDDSEKVSRAKAKKQSIDSADRFARRIIAATDTKVGLVKKIDDVLTGHDADLQREAEKVIGDTTDWNYFAERAVTDISRIHLDYILKEVIAHRTDVSKGAMAKLIAALIKLSDDATAMVVKLDKVSVKRAA